MRGTLRCSRASGSAISRRNAGARPISSPTAPICRARCLPRAPREPDIRIVTGATVSDFAVHARRRDRLDRPRRQGRRGACQAARRRRRRLVDPARPCRQEGQKPLLRQHRLARHGPLATGRPATFSAGSPDANCVSVFAPSAQSTSIVYPLRGGDTLNLVAVTAGQALGENWSGQADAALLAGTVAGAPSEIRKLIETRDELDASGRSIRSRSTARGRSAAPSR